MKSRTRTFRFFAGLLFVEIFAIAPVLAQRKLSAHEAKDHIGEKTTVCGNVVSTHYAARSKGNPTFLNLDEPYPKQIFTILIWGTDRPKFGDPEAKYGNRRICVTGTIQNYREVPEIIARDPTQIQIASVAVDIASSIWPNNFSRRLVLVSAKSSAIIDMRRSYRRNRADVKIAECYQRSKSQKLAINLLSVQSTVTHVGETVAA